MAGVDADDVPVVLLETGRGRHTVVLSPQRRSNFTVGVAIHHRWVAGIVAMKYSALFHSLSIDLKVKKGACFRIISSHIPPGPTAATRISSSTWRYDRRFTSPQSPGRYGCEYTHWIGAGDSDNFWRRIGDDVQKADLAGEHDVQRVGLDGRGLRALNTFEDWWRRSGATSSSSASTSSRSTWRAVSLANTCKDPSTACWLTSLYREGLLQLAMVEHFECEVRKGFGEFRPTTIADITNVMKTASFAVARMRRRARACGLSEMEDSLRPDLRIGSTSPEQRHLLLGAMWAQRHRIAAEQTSSAAWASCAICEEGGWERDIGPGHARQHRV